jgi:very-short-patch-repair endonuclease
MEYDEKIRLFLLPRTHPPAPSLVREGGALVDDEPFLPYRWDLLKHSRKLRKNQTKAEKVLWRVLQKRAFENLRFVRQKPLICYIADFYCSELKLAIEVDGDIHEARFDYDNERSIELEEYGITVIRYTNEQVLHQLQNVLLNLSNIVEKLKKYSTK